MAWLEPTISPNSTLHNVQRDELEHKLALILSKVTQVEAQLAVLNAEHAQLLTDASYYQAALAPWKRIPNEILQRIFSLTKSDEDPKCIPFSRKVTPMQLLQVCSRWREVAIETPAIWQELKWVYLPPKQYNQQEVFAFLQTWISRAAYEPLSIVAKPLHHNPNAMDQDGNFGTTIAAVQIIPQLRAMHGISDGDAQWDVTGTKFNIIKDVILPNSSRIRNLHLTFPQSCGASILPFLEKEADFASLEEITIECVSPFTVDASDNLSPIYPLLKNAPRLETLNLKLWLHHLTSPIQLPAHWSHITHFEIGMVPSPVFFPILSVMTSLESCKASIHWTDPNMLAMIGGGLPAGITMMPVGTPWHFTSISHSTLRILDLTCYMGIYPGHPLTPLEPCNFPKLEELSLTSDAWDILATSFLRGTTALRELRLQYPQPIGQVEMMAAFGLPALSQLTHLSVRSVSYAPEYPGGYTIGEGAIDAIASGRVLPRLHTFEFEGQLTIESLVYLLRSKGFVSAHDGSTIFPNLGGPTINSKAGFPAHGTGAVAFEKVKILGCKPDMMNDPKLARFQEQVGEECFVMEEPLGHQDFLPHYGW